MRLRCLPLRRLWSALISLCVVLAPTLGALGSSPAHAAGASALQFSGTNDVQVANNASLTIPSNLTLEAWVKPTSVSAFADVVGKSGYELAIQPAGTGFQALFQLSIGGTWYSATTVAAGPLALNQWYHLAATYDGATMRIFVNGTPLGSLSQPGSIDASSAPLRIATVDASSDFFSGEVDEVRLSNVVRYTAAFNPTTTPFATDASTRGLWHLDEGTGTTTADASGNNNTGSLVGSPHWATDSPIGSTLAAPTISGIGTTRVQAGVATITWTTSTPSTSQVAYGPTAAYGSQSVANPSLDVTHSVTLDGLTPGTAYNFQALSRDVTGNLATSTNQTFSTTDAASTSAVTGEWSAQTNWPLVDVHSILLYTGDVLMWDAWETGGTPSVRLWHPSTNTFTSVPNLTSQIFCSGMASLPDGRVLVVGGHNGGEVGIKDANIFDPATSTWKLGPSMASARWYPSATELPDGRVVAFSGNTTPTSFANTPEVYNPTSNAWASLSPISTSDIQEDEYPLSFVLPSGKLFTLGPSTGRTRLLDPTALTYGAAVTGNSPVLNGSAAMYRPGKILTTGGGPLGGATTTGAAVLDMTAASPAWHSVAPMAFPRYMHNLTMLPDGNVFAVGGSSTVDQTDRNGSLPAEIWDPTTETWTTMAAEVSPRMYHSTSVLLPDGRVLVAGGGRWSTAFDYYNAEIFSPPYLFKGARPTISGAPASAGYGTSITVQTPDAASITAVALTDLGSDTHRGDMNQHYVPLTFTPGSGALTVQTPGTPNLAPPGYYLLWLVNANGVPSVAQTIQISGSAPTDTQAPSISMSAPADGSTVSGPVTLTASASDNVGVASVQMTLDGAPLGSPLTSSPYTLAWDSTTVPNGPHSLAARATDAAGNTASATAVSVTVSNVAAAPVISAVASSAIGASGATITWTTNAPASSQVEYGPTTAYGSTTTLDTTPVTSHSQTLTGLSPSTTYNYAAMSSNAAGQSASANLTFTTAAAAPTLLVGDQKIEASVDSNTAGTAEALQYTATTTGTANSVFVYLDAGNAATKVTAGLYTNTAANNPGSLLGQATMTAPVKGGWNSVAIPPLSVTAGTKYWIAILSPSGSGGVKFRDLAAGGPTQISSQTTLAALPATWSSGASFGNAPASAYLAGTTTLDTTPPSVALSSPPAGNVTGSVSVAATASDSIGVTSVQFTLDGSNLGQPVTAPPYQVTWDTTTALDTQHTLGAQARDAAGNASSAANVTVTVANPLAVISAVQANATSSGATITWTTDRPATSQVEYGATSAYGSTTALNASLATSHSQVLTGLTASTTYHYRVDSKDAGGNLVNSTDFSFATDAPAPPAITGVAANSITPIGATIAWTTDQPATSEVTYGTSTLLGSTTGTNPTLATSHSVNLTGLSPSTTYFCAVVSKNAAGATTTSPTISFTTLAPAPIVLAGDAKIEGNTDNNSAGSAEAFQYTASTSGTANKLFVYVASTNTASSVIVGLYTNTTANNPGTLLGQGSIPAPTKGAWNSVTIPGVPIAAGTKYWIALLGPSGAGTVQFRDLASGGPTQTSAQTNLATLPTTWSPGANWANAPASAYAAQAP